MVQADMGHGMRSMRPARASGRAPRRAACCARSYARRELKTRYIAFMAAFSGFQAGSVSTIRPRRCTSTRGMSIATGQTS